MYKRGEAWWTCIRYKGKKYQKSLETHSKKAAQAIEAKIRTEIIEGKYFEKQIGDTKGFSDLMEKRMREHAPKLSEKTQKSSALYLKNLKSSFDNKVLSEITPGMIYDYKVLRYGEGVKPATINKENWRCSQRHSAWQ
ncbi:MAG: hypothetical protein MRJ65_14060 [Candidatus Brocadiaceae bacterium]|nr:hypothetical protein [Candidatus Brocadiaceae bacterium]